MSWAVSRQELAQPLYLLCDASRHMSGQHLLAANLLLGHLADRITAELHLATTVRLSILEFNDSAWSLLGLSPLDLGDPYIPSLAAALPDASFAAAMDDVRPIMSSDLAQLDADDREIRPPIIVVVTAGQFADQAAERSRALDELMTTSLLADQSAPWSPTTIVVGLGVPAPAVITDLVTPVDNALAIMVELDEDPAPAAGRVAQVIDHSVRSGMSGLRADRWIISTDQLGALTQLEATDDVVVHEAPDFHVPLAREPLRYLAFINLEDAEAHPYGELLDLMAVGDAPELPGGHIADVTNWPLRLVVAEDNAFAVRGLVVPPSPPGFGVDLPDDLLDTDRAALCRELATIVELAHGYRVELGPAAIESAAYTLTPVPRVLLQRCDAVRLRDSPYDAWRLGDLAILGRMIARYAGSAVLDDVGRRMLWEASSNTAGVVPTAGQWRNYLAGRFLDLQGPPVITEADLTPPIVAAGEAVTVRWRSRFADAMSITAPDGQTVAAPRDALAEGEISVPMQRSGRVRLRVTNSVGHHQVDLETVHVFSLPELREIQVPSAEILAADWCVPEFAEAMNEAWAMDQSELAEIVTVAGPTPPPDVIGGPAPEAKRPDDAHLVSVAELATFPIDVIGWYARPIATPGGSRRRKWGFPWV